MSGADDSIVQIDSRQLQEAATELDNLKQQTVTLRENLELLNHSVSGLTSKAESIPATVLQISKSVSRTAEEGLTDLKAKLDLLRGDIEGIDKLVTEFVEMQTRKVTGDAQTLRIVGT